MEVEHEIKVQLSVRNGDIKVCFAVEEFNPIKINFCVENESEIRVKLSCVSTILRNGYCEHNRYKKHCPTCSPWVYCVHGKRKSRCRICDGKELCEHDKQNKRCRICSPESFCEHDIYKQGCIKCNPNYACIHGKRKYICRICQGGSICKHNIIKQFCRECGNSYCEHGKRKRVCPICDGVDLCEHGLYKQNCRQCDGRAYCEHGKLKTRCFLCNGSGLCKSEWCEKIAIRKYKGYCLNCFIHLFPDEKITTNYKTKEKDVSDRVLARFPNFSWVADKRVVDGCSRRRPDLLLDMGSHIIIVEVDEHKHEGYDCSCENKRLMEISQDLQHRPIVFIRFNPDAYTDTEGNLVKSCWSVNGLGLLAVPRTRKAEWEQRIEVLFDKIQHWIDFPSEKTVEIVELFY